MLLSRQNQLLATLPSATYQKWEKHLALRELKKRTLSQYQEGEPRGVFPDLMCRRGLFAKCLELKNFYAFFGSSFAVGLVNMVASDHAVVDGIICGEGYAMAVPSELVMRSIETPSLSGEAQSTAMARTAKGGLAIAQCFGSHTAKQLLARFLLQVHDCFGVERPVTLTQQALGEMLMARRESAAEILAEWNWDGVVELKREAIHIRSANTLKRTSCDCCS